MAATTPTSGRSGPSGLGARFVHLLVTACIGIGGLALVAMMLHVCLDIFLREGLGIVVPGALEAVSFFYMVACICLAFPIMQMAGEQVVVEVFLQKLSAAALKPFELLGAVLTLAYAGYLGVAAIAGAMDATEYNEMQLVGDMDLIIWPSRWVTATGFAIMALVVLWQIVRIWKNQSQTTMAQPEPGEGEQL